MGKFIIDKRGCNLHTMYKMARALLINSAIYSCEQDVIDAAMQQLMCEAETPHDYMLLENIHKEYLTALTLLRTIRGVMRATGWGTYRITLRLHLGWKEYQIVMEHYKGGCDES